MKVTNEVTTVSGITKYTLLGKNGKVCEICSFKTGGFYTKHANGQGKNFTYYHEALADLSSKGW